MLLQSFSDSISAQNRGILPSCAVVCFGQSGSHLREVDCASSGAGVDIFYERSGHFSANGGLGLFCGASNVRRQDNIGDALQLCSSSDRYLQAIQSHLWQTEEAGKCPQYIEDSYSENSTS